MNQIIQKKKIKKFGGGGPTEETTIDTDSYVKRLLKNVKN